MSAAEQLARKIIQGVIDGDVATINPDGKIVECEAATEIVEAWSKDLRGDLARLRDELDAMTREWARAVAEQEAIRLRTLDDTLKLWTPVKVERDRLRARVAELEACR